MKTDAKKKILKELTVFKFSMR